MSAPLGSYFFRSVSSAAGSGMTGIAFATFTPTGSWTSNATYTGGYSRLGEYMFMSIKIACTGAPAGGGGLSVNLPTGFTMDTGKVLQNASAIRSPLLSMGFLDKNAGSAYPLFIGENDPVSVIVSGIQNTTILGTSYIVRGGVSGTQPVALANSDTLVFSCMIPIIGWAP